VVFLSPGYSYSKAQQNIFDVYILGLKLGRLNYAVELKDNLYIQFVMGVKNAMPADLNVFEYYISTVKRLLPKASWCGAGIGKDQKILNEWCIKLGGHVRTGLEDNIRIDKDNLAPSNASLVKIAKDICEQYNRPVASWKKAREILELG